MATRRQKLNNKNRCRNFNRLRCAGDGTLLAPILSIGRVMDMTNLPFVAARAPKRIDQFADLSTDV